MVGFARVGDRVSTVAGPGTITEGSSNTFIDGIPASRLGDRFVLDAGGMGTITSGSPTVKINGIPAARLGDATSPTGTIVSASSRVLTG